MKIPRIRTFAAALAMTVVAATPLCAQAQDHVVTPDALQQGLNAAAATRQQNEQTMRDLFAQPRVQQALRAGQIAPEQVSGAISQLSDAELARLAARSAAAQKDFAAGNISDHDLLIILVGIAALLLIIVAVH